MSQKIENLPASVHDRLKRIARARQRPFQEIFSYYAMERFLYRLSQSSHYSSFVLKGGLMFLGWGLPLRRPTRDIDMQGYTSNSIEDLESVIREICLQHVIPDGMRYDSESIHGERIIESNDYQGVRIQFTGHLGKAVIYLHIDVSFANEIIPGSVIFEYPPLLDNDSFELRGYPYETAIAEKFQAMTILGAFNDRLKDYYDIWLLSRSVDVSGMVLARAIRATFIARKTVVPIDETPFALSDEFAVQKQRQWETFLKKFTEPAPDLADFSHVIGELRKFLLPPLLAIGNSMDNDLVWKAGGPWTV